MDTVNYKCPNCSAGLAFDSKSQKMKCEYCGNTYSLEELEQLAEQQDTVKEDTTTHWEGFEPEQWQSDEKSNMAVWSCPSCGAEVLAEKTTGATICPYCDNPMIMPEQFADTYRPDYVIPFKKSKKEAKRQDLYEENCLCLFTACGRSDTILYCIRVSLKNVSAYNAAERGA